MSAPTRSFDVSRPTSLTPEETEDGVRILYEGLSPNIVMRAVAGYDPDILRTVFQTRLEAAVAVDALWVAKSKSDGKLVGVMITNLPGSESGASSAIPKSDSDTHGWRDGIAKEHREWLDTKTYFYPVFIQFNKDAFGPNGYKNDVYVNLLCTSSSHRKQGIGKALMDEAWAEAIRQNTRSSLITQGDYNVSLYSAMGYKTTHTVDLEFQGEKVRSYGMVAIGIHDPIPCKAF